MVRLFVRLFLCAATCRALVPTPPPLVRISQPLFATTCRWCGETFSSRNALFRHVKSSKCFEAAVAEDPLAEDVLKQGNRRFAVMTVGYLDRVESLEFGEEATRATDWRHRSRTSAFSQNVPAFGDVVSVAYRTPHLPKIDNVTVLSVSETKRAFHAEAKCAERAYHYLLPLDWLRGWADDGTLYFAPNNRGTEEKQGVYGILSQSHVSRGITAESASRKTMQSLKRVLREVERVFGGSDQSSWHNFAGQVYGTSPHHKSMTSRLRRCRAVELFKDDEGRGHAVIELRAQNFVGSQIPRLIAAIVAVQRGLLPLSYFEYCSRTDVVIPNENALIEAPARRFYFAGARYKSRRHNAGIRDVHSCLAVNSLEIMSDHRGFLTQLRRHMLMSLGDDEEDGGEDFVAQLKLSAENAAAAFAKSLKVVEEEHAKPVATHRDRRRTHSPPPKGYERVLDLLREIDDQSNAPRTSTARARIIRGDSTSGSFTLANPSTLGKKSGPLGNSLFPELAAEVFALESRLRRGGKPSSNCAVNRRAAFVPHVDSGQGLGQSKSFIVGLGDYDGGELVVEGVEHDVRYSPLEFDGWNLRHWTKPFVGDRYSLVFFTPLVSSNSKKQQTNAKKAAEIAAEYGLAYRRESTDVEAIVEVLGSTSYGRFDPKGHHVLDFGAHIGCFSRWVLENGASSVRGFEPEEENARLARRNVPGLDLVQAAVVRNCREKDQKGILVLGPPRARDGASNTWRHALEEYSHYADRSRQATVSCIPFFDQIEDQTTMVKLDVEGAELEILDDFPRGAWKNVEKLVFEYSFTKRPSLKPFRTIVSRLEQEGFEVSYDFRDTLVDDPDGVWPGHTDALIFCSR